jgi:hypothetical protein
MLILLLQSSMYGNTTAAEDKYRHHPEDALMAAIILRLPHAWYSR